MAKFRVGDRVRCPDGRQGVGEIIAVQQITGEDVFIYRVRFGERLVYAWQGELIPAAETIE